MAPLLILLVVFVLWAGRAGRAVLVADLAAGEAAVAAAVCCEDGPSPEAEQAREEVVEQVLRARPSLDFLCIGGIRPAALGGDDGGFVDEAWRERFDDENPGRASGVGVVGVRLQCETDAAVAPLRGLFPTVSFYGQASEVIPIPPRLLIHIDEPDDEMEGDDGDNNRLVFEILLSAPAAQEVTINYETTPDETTAGPDDYKPTSDSITISQGEYNKTIEISITGDDDPEEDESLVLELTLALPDQCGPDAHAWSDNASSADEIPCEDPGDPYWKTSVAGTILNDDP